MKRRSFITITILLVILILLILTLIYVNLKYNKQDDNYNEENSEQIEENIYISLDSDIVKDVYRLLRLDGYNDFFYSNGNKSITVEDLSDEDIQTIAFYYNWEELKDKINNDEYVLEKSDMDKYIENIFGIANYEPSFIYLYSKDFKIAKYDKIRLAYTFSNIEVTQENSNMHMAIEKVIEHSDKYEVITKMVYLEKSANSETYDVYNGYIKIPNNKIGTISEADEIEKIKTLYVEGEEKEFTNKVISNFYNQATTHKHTFNKRDDGSYYWYKTEIID